MSRSNNTELINPAVRFFDWSGLDGVVNYFDKSLGEKGERVPVDMPFRFLVLDRVAQVTGGVDRYGSFEGFWSNAVRNTKTQPFTVRSKQGVEVQGLYEHIKGHPGVRFMQGLYIAFHDENQQLVIGYLKLKGAAFSAWLDFTKAHRDIYEGAFSIADRVKRKKGATTYYAPVFEHYANVSEESDAAAKALDVHLQEYLTAYFANNGQQNEMAYAASAGSSGGNDDGGGWTGSDEPEMAPFQPTEPPEDFVEDDEIPF